MERKPEGREKGAHAKRARDVCAEDEGRRSASHSRDYLLLGLTGSHRMSSGLLVGFRFKKEYTS